MDLLKYKAELEAKLEAVNKVIADMGGKTKPKRIVTAETRAKMKAAWAKRKAKDNK